MHSHALSALLPSSEPLDNRLPQKNEKYKQLTLSQNLDFPCLPFRFSIHHSEFDQRFWELRALVVRLRKRQSCSERIWAMDVPLKYTITVACIDLPFISHPAFRNLAGGQTRSICAIHVPRGCERRAVCTIHTPFNAIYGPSVLISGLVAATGLNTLSYTWPNPCSDFHLSQCISNLCLFMLAVQPHRPPSH